MGLTREGETPLLSNSPYAHIEPGGREIAFKPLLTGGLTQDLGIKSNLMAALYCARKTSGLNEFNFEPDERDADDTPEPMDPWSWGTADVLVSMEKPHHSQRMTPSQHPTLDEQDEQNGVWLRCCGPLHSTPLRAHHCYASRASVPSCASLPPSHATASGAAHAEDEDAVSEDKQLMMSLQLMDTACNSPSQVWDSKLSWHHLVASGEV